MIELGVVLFLIFMEGLLSFDNALALAVLVRKLPIKQRRKALTYGIWGAFIFRAVALVFLTQIMSSMWAKLIGGGYLILVALKGLLSDEDDAPSKELSPFNFWKIVAIVELTDIAFSIDSILASVAVSTNYYVVLAGGLCGILMMRFVASLFIFLLNMFSRLEKTAFILILIVGIKLIIETWFDYPKIVFWVLIIGAICFGLSKKSKKPTGGTHGFREA